MARLRLFASARDAAGVAVDELPGTTVDAVIEAACVRYGEAFRALLPSCRVWCNGDECHPDTPVTDTDEVAVLPPVSGG